jgi:transcriptional regulator with XRE-family HTH domain
LGTNFSSFFLQFWKEEFLLNKIGKILKQERIKNNLTLEALSNISDISISTLSKMENDKIRNVSSVFLYRLSNILNIDYDYLTRQRWDILPTFLYERNHNIAGK